jgi:hypothetical protein
VLVKKGNKMIIYKTEIGHSFEYTFNKSEAVQNVLNSGNSWGVIHEFDVHLTKEVFLNVLNISGINLSEQDIDGISFDGCITIR